jgi:fructose transport system permease protein
MADATDGVRPEPQEFERVLAAAATSVASFDEESLPLSKRIQRFLHSFPTVVPFVVLVLGLLLGISVNYSHFVTGSNLSTVLTQVTIVGFLGIAQTLVILTAGIDLSVGVIMVISSVVMGRLAVVDGLPLIVAFPAGLLCGVAFGFLNGILVTRWQMPPFIVTLGTLSIIGALNTFYSQSETIREQDIDDSAPFLQSMGIPVDVFGSRIILGSFLLILLAIVVWYVLNRTAYGRHLYATGDDPEAARLAGINTDRILLSVYVLAGLISASGGRVV